jgi:ferredoxin
MISSFFMIASVSVQGFLPLHLFNGGSCNVNQMLNPRLVNAVRVSRNMALSPSKQTVGDSQSIEKDSDGPVLDYGDGEMVAVDFRNSRVMCKQGDLLRSALLRNKVTPHNGRARIINCRGLGTCGTCAVEVAGIVSPPHPNAIERGRLSLPPFSAASSGRLRLACQLRVEQQPGGAPLQLTKYAGFWGQRVPQPSDDDGFELPFGELEFLLDRTPAESPPLPQKELP